MIDEKRKCAVVGYGRFSRYRGGEPFKGPGSYYLR